MNPHNQKAYEPKKRALAGSPRARYLRGVKSTLPAFLLCALAAHAAPPQTLLESTHSAKPASRLRDAVVIIDAQCEFSEGKLRLTGSDDARATRDLPALDRSIVSARDVHRGALAELADRFATVVPSLDAIPD